MRELVIMFAKWLILYLIYLPFGIIFLPFCVLKVICDAIYYINEKLLDSLWDIFGLDD